MLHLNSQRTFTLRPENAGNAPRRNKKSTLSFDKPIDIEEITQALKKAQAIVGELDTQPSANFPAGDGGRGDVESDLEPPLKRVKMASEPSDDGRKLVDIIHLSCDVKFQTEGTKGWKQAMKGNYSTLRLLDILESKCGEENTLAFNINGIDCNIHAFDPGFNDNEVYKELSKDANELSWTGRTKRRSDVHIIAHPLSRADDDMFLPFSLRITETISLVTPNIFEPMDVGNNKRLLMTQLRFLCKLFCIQRTAPTNFSKTVDMSFFISSMNPAPSLPSILAQDAAQPEALLPCLLPFQRNSVGWLLEREGKSISREGTISSKVLGEADLPLFWKRVECIPGQPWFLNTVTGRLLPHRPPDNRFLGGILAEEPGLGKTLESVALVLLNPATGREPSRKKWDPIGKLHVREVKVSVLLSMKEHCTTNTVLATL